LLINNSFNFREKSRFGYSPARAFFLLKKSLQKTINTTKLCNLFTPTCQYYGIKYPTFMGMKEKPEKIRQILAQNIKTRRKRL